jgi:hypothetical protein
LCFEAKKGPHHGAAKEIDALNMLIENLAWCEYPVMAAKVDRTASPRYDGGHWRGAGAGDGGYG